LVEIYEFPLFWHERNNLPINRMLGPLPESTFVVAARETIPETRVRVTTASARGNFRGRGRGRGTSTREQSKHKEPTHQQSNSRGRGKGKKRVVDAATSAGVQAIENEATDK
jgi:hypothetical protein